MLQCFVKPKSRATGQSFIWKEITTYRIGTLIGQKVRKLHCFAGLESNFYLFLLSGKKEKKRKREKKSRAMDRLIINTSLTKKNCNVLH